MTGHEVVPHALDRQVAALGKLGEQTGELVGSAGRLADRLPQLGTAPPALHLAQRLREAAGHAGLTGELGAADTELTGFHEALRAGIRRYQEHESGVREAFQRLERQAE
ncbi:hypothetical protein CU254_05525 [Amycolatopsis sp. AA4]|uniref:hypothetical protein n=1 Tax=Actinomycetes TaxID=1760 RepID=UPI0001B53F59|nr:MULTISPECIES: hypothetical protein [Actinomycetes]ATY09982.1 hypothetical protein CU254_05525 [Amycolatopsis sp. AA4]EFL05404.1 predicted protein [Streptomyces sp. AA4]